MMTMRMTVLAAIGLASAGCSLPQPAYLIEKTPPAYRIATDGTTRVDNENYPLDAQGYRIGKNGERVGEVDVQAKAAPGDSNAVAGYYISRTAPMVTPVLAPGAPVRLAPAAIAPVQAAPATGAPTPLIKEPFAP